MDTGQRLRPAFRDLVRCRLVRAVAFAFIEPKVFSLRARVQNKTRAYAEPHTPGAGRSSSMKEQIETVAIAVRENKIKLQYNNIV